MAIDLENYSKAILSFYHFASNPVATTRIEKLQKNKRSYFKKKPYNKLDLKIEIYLN